MPDRLLRAALDYAELLGFSVFGVLADCRIPCKVIGRFEHGCHDATKDPEEIRYRWGSAHPRANIAVACGPKSGVVVLDIDAKGAVDGFESLRRLEGQHGELPLTWCSRTPSGGEHRYFRHPDGVELRNKVGLRSYDGQGRVAEKFQGLDIRTAGGSVALPPSCKPHGAYAWKVDPSDVPLADAPKWLVELAKDPPLPPRNPAPPLRLSDMDRLSRYVAAAVDRECDRLSGMAQASGRNLQLFQASANLGELVGAGLLPQATAEQHLEDAAAACGLLQEDGFGAVRATIASGLRRGMANPREVRQ